MANLGSGMSYVPSDKIFVSGTNFLHTGLGVVCIDRYLSKVLNILIRLFGLRVIQYTCKGISSKL